MPRYVYNAQGTAAASQTWEVSGEIYNQQGFNDALQEVSYELFVKLTEGKAVFGQPGVTCRGPYTITRFLMERQDA